MIFVLIGLLLLSLVVANLVRGSWAFGLPGIMLLILLLYMVLKD